MRTPLRDSPADKNNVERSPAARRAGAASVSAPASVLKASVRRIQTGLTVARTPGGGNGRRAGGSSSNAAGTDLDDLGDLGDMVGARTPSGRDRDGDAAATPPSGRGLYGFRQPKSLARFMQQQQQLDLGAKDSHGANKVESGSDALDVNDDDAPATPSRRLGSAKRPAAALAPLSQPSPVSRLRSDRSSLKPAASDGPASECATPSGRKSVRIDPRTPNKTATEGDLATTPSGNAVTNLRRSARISAPARTPEVTRSQRRIRANKRLASVVDVSEDRSASDNDDEDDDGSSDEKENDDDDDDDSDVDDKRTTANNEPDESSSFFHAHAPSIRSKNGSKSKKATTSNNTLSQLPPLDAATFHAAITNAPVKHATEKQLLMDLHRDRFTQWAFELSHGFNLLLYGFGSKRHLVEAFAYEALPHNAPVLIINGCFPSMTLKEIVCRVLTDVIGVSTYPSSIQDQIAMIVKYFDAPDCIVRDVYLVIHNIDGPAMRSDKTQTGLSSLAACAGVHVIATVDNMNAGLLWDTVKLARFNWLWQDATTCADYLVETSFENTVMLMRDGDLGFTGTIHVLKSLTANARKMFRFLVRYQMDAVRAGDAGDIDGARDDDHDGDADNDYVSDGNAWSGSDDTSDHDTSRSRGKRSKPKPTTSRRQPKTTTTKPKQRPIAPYAGITFQRFYQMANESFLVNNELTFRTQLTEFRDHKMILSRRGADGAELLYIPFEMRVLASLLEDTEW